MDLEAGKFVVIWIVWERGQFGGNMIVTIGTRIRAVCEPPGVGTEFEAALENQSVVESVPGHVGSQVAPRFSP